MADLQRRLLRPPLQHLTKITAANVKHLSLAWIYDLPAAAAPSRRRRCRLAACSTSRRRITCMRSTRAPARELWHYTLTRSRGGIQIGNRGVAVLGDTVYFVTPDCNLVALDIKTGTEKWAKEFCSLEMMYYGSVAPVVVKDKLILGPSGDDLDVPAYLEAREPGERRADLALVRHAAERGRRRARHLAEPRHGQARRRHDVAADHLRSRAESDLRHDRQSAAGGRVQEPRRARTCSPRRSSR